LRSVPDEQLITFDKETEPQRELTPLTAVHRFLIDSRADRDLGRTEILEGIGSMLPGASGPPLGATPQVIAGHFIRNGDSIITPNRGVYCR